MRIPQIIGERMRQARTEAGLTQADVGMRLLDTLGDAWPPQTVSAAEKGRRDFRAEDLYAIALALGRPVEYFFTPPEGSEEIELPGSTVLWKGKTAYVQHRTIGQTMAAIRQLVHEAEQLAREEE